MTDTFHTDLAELADLRRRVLNDEPVTAEEYAVVLQSIRKHRLAGAARKAAATKAPVDTQAILTGLQNI